MLQFSGEREFSLPPAELFRKMRDARFLATCVPDAISQDDDGDIDHAKCKVKPGLSFIKGTLDVTIEVLEATEPNKLRWLLSSKGIGSTSSVEATLNLTEKESHTEAMWNAEVKELGGLLKAVPKGFIRGAAHKVIDDVWNGVEARLQEE